MYKRYNAVHFVGIGGVGMSGIAEVLHALGYKVTGSDLRESEATRRLSGLGIGIKIGHGAQNVPEGAQVVVTSTAVGPGNPEITEAASRRIPVIPRAEMLAELGRLKYGVLVAGSHGKTTTTSLIATTLSGAGLDPTVVIGGRLNAMGSNARHGKGDFLVAEADESDGSFLKLSPTIAVVTNIDREHMDYFKSMRVLKEAFLDFMGKVPFYGLNIACADDPNLAELLPEVTRRVLTYGLSEVAQLRAMNIKKDFMSVEYDAVLDGDPLFRVRLPIPGEHNVLNSLAAIGAALELEVKPELIKEALGHFQGIGRRLELKGRGAGVSVYDDYGHHPAEIKATIKSLKDGPQQSRLVVVFQPHRYTRTRDLFAEFSESFDLADALVLLDIYPAGEPPIEGVSSEALFPRLRARLGDRAVYLKDKEHAADYLAGMLKEGDIALTLGAGDVWKSSEELVRRLNRNGR
jgi:UDP-N-acetylmuramate--alanine ligase